MNRALVSRACLVRIALAQDAAVALLDLGGLPGGIEVMQRHEAFLDVGAGAHLLRAADQHPDDAGADLLEQGLFLGVGVGIANRGDLLARYAVLDQLVDNFVIDGVPPRGRIHAHIREDELRAARRGGASPDLGHLLDEGIDL